MRDLVQTIATCFEQVALFFPVGIQKHKQALKKEQSIWTPELIPESFWQIPCESIISI